MRIGKTDAEAVQPASLHHETQFTPLRHPDLRQQIKHCKRLDAVLQRPERKLCDDAWMDENLTLVQGLTHFFISRTEMVDPDGSIGEYQFCRGLLWRVLLWRMLL